MSKRCQVKPLLCLKAKECLYWVTLCYASAYPWCDLKKCIRLSTPVLKGSSLLIKHKGIMYVSVFVAVTVPYINNYNPGKVPLLWYIVNSVFLLMAGLLMRSSYSGAVHAHVV